MNSGPFAAVPSLDLDFCCPVMKKSLCTVFAVVAMLVVVATVLMMPDPGSARPERGVADVPTAPPIDDPPLIVDEPGPTPEGMAWIPGGTFIMGTTEEVTPENPDRFKKDEYPAHEVALDGFWMDLTPVTNRQFAEFVDATGYVTFAEKKPTRGDFAASGVDTSLIQDKDLVPGSICFNCAFDHKNLVTGVPNWEYQVWQVVQGADWRHPEGPESSIEDRMDHPVVHVNWDDAVAYCHWAGKRLPTEAEFEYASRGGQEQQKYPWGNELVSPDGTYHCNFWQGTFPTERLNLDGFETTSPVKAFSPNAYGLYDMAGNVWEWCSDFYRADYYSMSPRRNPQGPEDSMDPQEPGIVKHAQRGGSFMCNTNNCTGFRCAARMRGEVTSGSFHNGFRCVVDPSMLESFHVAQQAVTAAAASFKVSSDAAGER